MKKAFITTALALLITVIAAVPALAKTEINEFVEADDPVYCSARADTDNDGRVTVSDARSILRAAVGLAEVEDEDFGRYDVNANGAIGVDDARDALRLAVGLTSRATHSKGSFVVTKEATCSSSGSAVTLCAHCGKVFGKAVIPNPGHVSTGRMLIKKATCTEHGLYEFRCKFCDILIKAEETPLLEHNWQGVKITCFKPINSVLTCKDCGATKTVITQVNYYHTFQFITVKEATCTEDGERIKVCTVCGEKSDDEPTVIKNFGGHRPSPWRTVSTVSCRVDGRRVKSCTRCGEILEEKIEPKYPHTRKEGTYTVDEPATCSSVGSAHFTCSECLQLVGVIIPKTPHKTVPGTVPTIKTATCASEGYITGECVDCGHYTETTPKLEHKPSSSWTQSVAATCTEKGKEVLYCTECGDVISERETPTNDANHDYELSGTVPPTCITDGKTLYTCTRCGKEFSTPIGAKGHTKSATAELIGEYPLLGYDLYAYRCTDCGVIISYEKRPR